VIDRPAYCRGKPLVVGTETVLLLDDAYVEDRWGVRRALNIPHKDPRNPVLMPDMPWEDSVGSPNVMYDEEAGLFRMWYLVMDRDAWMHQFRFKDWSAEKHGYPYFVSYAESRDGVRWDKPLLEGKPYKGHAKTNVLITGRQKAQAPRVTPNHPSTGQPGRFLMTYKDNLAQGKGCLCLAYSDDGLTWREDPANPVFVGLRDTWQNMVHDPKTGRWLMYTRPMLYAGVPDVPGGPTEHNYKRRVAVMVGDTPQTLGFARNVLWPDEHDEPDFDHMIVERVGNHFLGFLGQMSAPPHQAFRLHLAFSSDGLRWQQLPDRTPVLGRGGPDAFDSGSTASCGGIVPVGDAWLLYYRGSRRGQGSRDNVYGIGRAQVLRGRFVAQMGAHAGGFLLTREMIVGGPELIVNATTANAYNSDPATATAPPEFAAEVLAFTQGERVPRTVPGYGLADCNTEAVDMIDHKVTWQGKPDLAELVGKPVFIRFYLKNAGLYSLRFGEKA